MCVHAWHHVHACTVHVCACMLHTFPWLGGRGTKAKLQLALQLSRVLDQEPEEAKTSGHVHVIQSGRGACLTARQLEEGEVGPGGQLVVHEHAHSDPGPDGEEVVHGVAWELLQGREHSEKLSAH